MINIKQVLYNHKKSIANLINLVLVVLVIFFVFRFFKLQWGKISGSSSVSVDIHLLCLGVILFEIYWFYQIFFWRHVMRLMGEQLSFINTGVFLFTNCLLAYIPGKVANVVGMASLANKSSVSKSKTITTVVLFQIYALVSGILVVSILWNFVNHRLRSSIPFYWILLLWLFAIIGVICISPYFIKLTLSILRKVLKKDIADVSLPFKSHLVHLSMFFVAWFIMGFALLSLSNSFGSTLPFYDVFDVVLVFVVSYLMGVIAVTLPSGMGVVELGLLYGFSVLYNPKQAIFVAIAFRLTAIFTVLVSYFIFIGLRKKFNPSRPLE